MKVLLKKENGLYDISYYDKTKRETVVLNDVTEDVVKTLRKYKRDEDDYRKEAKANLVEIESYEENYGEIIDEESDFEEKLAEISNDRDLKQKLYKGMMTLYPQERKIIRMKFYEQKENNEIAEILGLKVQTVSQTKCRAMKKLREFIAKN